MTIRNATEADLPDIIEIYNATIASRMVTAEVEPVAVEQRLGWFRAHSPEQYPMWVTTGEERVTGWLSFQPFRPRSAYRSTAEISIYVHIAFRRQGIARRLLDQAIGISPRLAFTTLIGCIFGHNEPSLRLFGCFGFERWGLFPGIAQLDGVKRDLVILGRQVSVRE